ncbi:ATP-binding protein [Fodinicola feengrottensis]|uniref:ATP-binding protein n=1 Tax=Fodinicola feengrottensis TaxID=435914 RepID=A0ABP4U7K7_9ACTN
MAASPQSARAARTFVAEVLSEWDDHRRVEAAALLVSELVTNAIVHGDGPIQLSVDRTAHHAVLRVEVADHGSGLPTAQAVAADALSGRGLAIVAAVADRWGIQPTSTGKRVWFELSDV